MAELKVTGAAEMNATLAEMLARAPHAIAKALYQQANEVIADSVTNYVPFDTGTLAGSANVNLPEMTPNEVRVSFGFGGPAAPYAVVVHEHPRAGKTGGVSPQGKPYRHWARRGQWKYLETPLKAKAPAAAEALRQAINDSWDSARAERLAVATSF